MQWFNVIQKWKSQKNNKHKTTRLKPNSKKRTEISNLDVEVFVKKQVLGFQVSVHNHVPVTVVNAGNDLLEKSSRRRFLQLKYINTAPHLIHTAPLFPVSVHISGSNFTKVHSLLSFIAKTEWATILNYTLPRSKQSPFHVSQYTQRVHHLQHIPLP